MNVVALITTFVGSCITKETPLQPIQLLWVNLIMDSLAALALATELPTEALLHRMPQNRDDYIVARKMIKHILGMAIYQSILLFVFLFAGENIIPEPDVKWRCYDYYNVETGVVDKEGCGEYYENEFVYPGRLYNWDGSDLYNVWEKKYGPSRHLTFIFTAFVLMQIFNMIACRTIHDELNIFRGVHTNIMFIIIWLLIMGGQILIT